MARILRLAVLSGSEDLVKQIKSFRNFGASWSSRILQQALAWLINDQNTQEGITHAKAIYAARRKAMSDALRFRGVNIPERDGLAMWIPVPSEQFALVTPAARGIAVLPGERCRIGLGQFISIRQIHADKVDLIADAIVLAMG